MGESHGPRGVGAAKASIPIQHEVIHGNHSLGSQEVQVHQAGPDRVARIPSRRESIAQSHEACATDPSARHRIPLGPAAAFGHRSLAARVFHDGPHGIPRHVADGARGLLVWLEADVVSIEGREEERGPQSLERTGFLWQRIADRLGARVVGEVRSIEESHAGPRASLGDSLQRVPVEEGFVRQDRQALGRSREADGFSNRCWCGHIDRIHAPRTEE